MGKNFQCHTREANPETFLQQPSVHFSIPKLKLKRVLIALAPIFLSSLFAGACHAQSRDVVCREGVGDFAAEFHTGVSVRVGPARNGALEARVCAGTLSWNDQSLAIADAAAEVDVDAFGVDLGLGAPVVALQVKVSKGECCMAYNIYSLREPPVLLHSISGGDFFSAADTDLDGRVEIWTDDAAAVDGFENFHLRDLDFAPPLVLRFARGRLLDASGEFKEYYDQKIAELRARLADPQDLADFKGSDGKLLATSGIPAPRLVRLRIVKMKVLEIVWAYLYSGREQEAWRTLGELWPAADMDRIRAALVNVHTHGMRAQADGVSTPVPASRKIRTKIFDGTLTVSSTPGLTPKGVKPKAEITPPKAIVMERPAPVTALEIELAQSESALQLVIDAAGKVRSVDVLGKDQSIDAALVRSTANWKFIPAFSEGEPVASQILLGVSLKK